METTEKNQEKTSLSRSIRLGLGVGGVFLLILLGLFFWEKRKPTVPPLSESENSRILYLGGETGEDGNQLFAINPDGNEQKRLTDEPLGVLDYAVSPDGTQIAYSVVNNDDTVDLWQINGMGQNRQQLLNCPKAICTAPEWAPDGRRLIYERREIITPGEMPTNPQLWWLDTQTGETIPVFADGEQLGLGARISPNGRYLSYISPIHQEIHVYNIESGESIIIPSQTGQPATWSQDSQTLLISDIQFQGEQFSTHLFSTNLENAELTNISGVALDTNDSLPVFSPNGEWIAFGRKKPRAPMGKQLWLMHPDGSDAVGLTADADIHYNNPSWSPDGKQLVVQGFNQAKAASEPGLWLVDVAGGGVTELISSGMQPTWLP